jgi:hypothetical protein
VPLGLRRLAVVSAALGAVLLALWLVTPELEDRPVAPQDLPWHVEVLDDGSSRVLGIHLGEAALSDLIARFGSPDGLALFVGERSASLEAYFATVRLGRLEGRVVARLALADEEVEGLTQRAVGAEPAAGGSRRLQMGPADKAATGPRRVVAMSFLPKYRGLDAAFFRERLGEPPAWQSADPSEVRWYYPRLGLSLLLTAGAGTVLEYQPPRDFRVPQDAQGAGR